MIFRSDQFKFQISFMFRSAWFSLLDHRALSLPLKMAVWATYWPQTLVVKGDCSSRPRCNQWFVQPWIVSRLLRTPTVTKGGRNEGKPGRGSMSAPTPWLPGSHLSPISSAELMTNAKYNYKHRHKSKDQDKFIERWPSQLLTLYHIIWQRQSQRQTKQKKLWNNKNK